MILKHVVPALLVSGGLGSGSPLASRDSDPKVAQIFAAENVPKYVAPALNRDITDWLAIGDSFSAGISADVPSDQLEYWCSRFKRSYPNQINESPRFPGHSTSRTFAFGACTGAKMQDLEDKQLELGDPVETTYPKIGKPQIGTVSISGNDLKFGEIVNACLYHFGGYYGDCSTLLKEAHVTLDDPGKAFEYKIVHIFSKIMARARQANPSFQLYVTGYIQFWNADNEQCNTVNWAPDYYAPAYLTTTLRQDMNSLVLKLNDLIKASVEAVNDVDGGIYYVDGFQQKFDGHRFCEVEKDPGYHDEPIGDRTWFIHYESPYVDKDTVTGIGNGSFFEQLDSVLIPPKNGQSTADQIRAVNGNVSRINPAYKDTDSMTAALQKLAQDDVKYQLLPITWIRMMHPKGFGYTAMADAVIDEVLKFGAQGLGASATSQVPTTSQSPTCAGDSANKFLGRDDLNNQIGTYCADAAKQGTQDPNSGALGRTYNQGTRYEVALSMEWPDDVDIKQDLEANCKQYMTSIMDGQSRLPDLRNVP